MRLLLDTHAFVWWVGDATNLGQRARSAIDDAANEILLSVASLWELTIKRGNGKLDFPFDFETVVNDEGFRVLPISYGHLGALETLPRLHRDPFDRMLIAQAIADDLVLATRDDRLSAYGVTILW
ncbi:MAG TPA: type II toxin-antitoxin system VapC family toxin [Stellaceae bacterium]|nr:type II toxin-antitoxin system VapC family toxin [Stellaceae bacterium]